MSEEQEAPKQYIYVEPMGHGNHFVAEVAASTLVPGSVQLNVLRGDGSIDRTIGMNGGAIFRWTSITWENAVKIAAMLEQQQSIYTVDVPQRLLLEAARAETVPPPAEREDPDDSFVDEFNEGDDDDYPV